MSRPAPALHFLPLGGAGEIGMNLNLYEYDGAWLMCDLGVTFAGEELPGLDLVMPDIAFIEERRRALRGLVLTHAHEDHLGAVPYLWPRLGCPVYATPFAAALLRRKLEEGADGIDEIELVEVPLGGVIDLDPFRVELVTLTHSIPEPNALKIETPHGVVMHTGDWKLDPDPVISAPADEAALTALGDEGVLAMVCDSTNVFREGTSGSEAELEESLKALVGGCRGRVAVATFASNLARLLTVHEVARAHGRSVVVAGRSIFRILDCARETGYLPPEASFLSGRKAAALAPERTLYLMTGCQGEPNAALSRAADGEHPTVTLGRGDTAIFSSKIIPGNEKPIFGLINKLTRLGVEVITEEDAFVHVSGHPNRDELARMYRMIRPRTAVPVHGELRHLREHAALASSLQVPRTLAVENGAMVRLAPGEPRVVRQVPHGRVAWSGRETVPVAGRLVTQRRRLMYNGVAFATVVVDRAGELAAEPAVDLLGLLEEGDDADLLESLGAEAARAVESLRGGPRRRDDDALHEAVRRALRRALRIEFGASPAVEVHVVRL